MRYPQKSRRGKNSSVLGHQPGADQANGADWRAPVLALPKPATLGIWTRRVIGASAVWSVIELPFEIWVSLSMRDAIACITAKTLWVALVYFVLVGNRVARSAYAFLCTVGLMAVVFGLSAEYQVFPLAFVLSLVECTLKATATVCLIWTSVHSDNQ